MPLLDIATSQPSLQSNLLTFRSQAILRSKFFCRNDKLFGFLSKPFFIPEKSNSSNLGRFYVWRGGLMIKAVATLEPIRLTQESKDFSLRVDMDSGTSAAPGVEQPSLDRDSTEPDDREKLRRMRISRANKGNTPWNKGRKHTPETLRRIRERTRIAMQDPKVKMKLANLGHAQSEETRIKIGIGVRIGWEKRRGKIMLQETCLYEWQNLIAEASRSGVLGQEELQWNSYKILGEQLEQEWVQSVAERKRTPRVKGSKRAPKSLEQRRKISESIAAKWADPSYRNRVYAGLVKYHGITEGGEKKRRTTSSSDGVTRKRSPSKKVDSDKSANPESKSQKLRVRKRKAAPYKDPLASSKLEMLKSIRAERAAIESKKTEAIIRAKLLIAEAEKAANALEAASKQSPLARASLVETRKLIAEAVQSLNSINEGQEESMSGGSSTTLPASPEYVSNRDLEMHAESVNPEPNRIAERKVNGAHTLGSSNLIDLGFGYTKSEFQQVVDASEDGSIPGFSFRRPSHDLVNGKETLPQMSGADVNLGPRLGDNLKEHLSEERMKSSRQLELHHNSQLNGVKLLQQPQEEEKPAAKLANETRKKWVRGRLVEVVDEVM